MNSNNQKSPTKPINTTPPAIITPPTAEDIATTNAILSKENRIFIEKTIENKFDQILDKIPILDKQKINDNNISYDKINVYDLYKNTMNTIIEIINEIVNLIDEKKYISYDVFYLKLYKIFFNNKRLFYFGIILVILSFIIYFIDGATI